MDQGESSMRSWSVRMLTAALEALSGGVLVRLHISEADPSGEEEAVDVTVHPSSVSIRGRQTLVIEVKRNRSGDCCLWDICLWG